MGYRHLTEGERYQIAAYMKAKVSVAQIAGELGRSKSTIYRELERNSGKRAYQAEKAQRQYESRVCSKGWKRQIWHKLFDEVGIGLLKLGWSPAQISGYFAKSSTPVSHEWLYRRILEDKRMGGVAYTLLRCQKKRKKRYGKPDRRGQIIGRVSIDERLTIVQMRSRIGDWEADLVMGAKHQGALVSLVERASGFVKLVRVASKGATQVRDAIIGALHPIRHKVHTLTFDNGKEFAHHARIAKALKAQSYFADPYCSWQRGSNENLNGLVRQYYPKKTTDFTKVTDEEVASVEALLNTRPRKRLDWMSPVQVFRSGKSLTRFTS